MDNVVREVVEKGICSGCGVCAGVCPVSALSMKIQINGDLTPSLEVNRCMNNCKICLHICPFTTGVHNPRRINSEIYSYQADAKFAEDIGWYTHSVVGFRKDEELRRASASGGLATWCLETVLREGLVDRVAIVRLAEDRTKGFFEFFSVSTIDEIRQSSGSFYHPVEISGIIKAIKSGKEYRWAIIGVPCLCAALRRSALGEQVSFVFGLACGMYQNTFYTEMLLSESGIDREQIVSIEYRRKNGNPLAYNYSFRASDNKGYGKDIFYRGLPYFLGKNAYFRQNACNFCMDVFAETADACFMDAWLPDFSANPKGTSLVVIRNKEVAKLFQEGVAKDEIRVDNISAEEVIASQREHVRGKRELIYMRLRVNNPAGKIQNRLLAIEKIVWLLKRRAQNRSKVAWAKYGRKYGVFGFWLAMADMLLIQGIVNVIDSLPRLLSKLINRWRVFPQSRERK